ncbi:MAG: DUF1684 domain-containing protein [Myxococcota bacterium]|nr:DUF1684 domain-containing protein [Myxococcota bacterium]
MDSPLTWMWVPLAILAAGAAIAAPVPAPAPLEAEIQAWHDKRLKNLTAEEGWLSLVGLYWLEPGKNTAGSAEDSQVVFPLNAPARLGTFTLENGKVRLEMAKGVAATLKGKQFTGGVLKSDLEGEADTVHVGSIRFHLIQRGEKFGIRAKDPQAKARAQFHGIPRYPVAARWKVEAKFVPFAEPKKIAVPTVMGTVEELTAYGELVFSLDGQEHRLQPVQDTPAEKLFVIFADPTNKKDSYGAGRFLYADPPKNGKTTLDFNRSYNPPCAFSAFATCPLPPRENRLKVAIEAGEKRYGDH